VRYGANSPRLRVLFALLNLSNGCDPRYGGSAITLNTQNVNLGACSELILVSPASEIPSYAGMPLFVVAV